jgi:hypothetical protein
MDQKNPSSPSKETDFLKYRGNEFPRVLRFAWTLLIVFCIFYMAKWFWPELMQSF